MKNKSTKELILESGKKMFLKKGFKSTPLRGILKDAGYTLGAFYGYFSTKEDLFYALTDEAAEGLKNLLEDVHKEAENLPPERMIFDIMECYYKKLPEIVDYIYSHKEEMILLMKCSAGTKYESFLKSFSDMNKNSIKVGVERAKEAGLMIHGLETDTFELLMRSYSEITTHIIIEGKDKEQIFRMLRDVGAVFRNGMMSLMGENKTKTT